MELTLDQHKTRPRAEISEPRPDLLLHHNVVVIIPSYNEERFIGSVVLKLCKHSVTVIVVDDGSSDATATIAEAAGATVIRHETNRGKGEALNTGLCESRYLRPDVVVMIDGDGQHLPEQLPRLVQPVLEGKADIVIGSRYLGPSSQVPRHRIIGHRFFNLLTRTTSGVTVTDSQSGYRAFSPRAYQAELFHCSDFSVESEMQFLAHEHHLTVLDVPITVEYNEKEKRSAYKQGLIVLNGILRLTGQYRPLFFFGVPGLVFLLTGVGMGILVVDIYRRVQQLAVGYAMISVLLTVIGMIGLSTGITLHSIRGLLVDMLRPKINDKGEH